MNAEESDVVARLENDINTYWKETIANIILGNTDINIVWDMGDSSKTELDAGAGHDLPQTELDAGSAVPSTDFNIVWKIDDEDENNGDDED